MEPDATSPSVRMRRRAFLNETNRLSKKQSGVTVKHDVILEGVYELEPKPDWRTEARLAQQLNLDPVAVKVWFRNRRVKDKRRNARRMGTGLLFSVFFILTCAYLWELDGLERLMQQRKASGVSNRSHMTKSGLPRPYPAKGPFEKQFQKPSKMESTTSSGSGTKKAASTTSKTTSSQKTGTTSSGRVSSYFSSASGTATASGRVRKAEVDVEWDKKK